MPSTESDPQQPAVLVLFDDEGPARELQALLERRGSVTVRMFARPMVGLDFTAMLTANAVVLVTAGTFPVHLDQIHGALDLGALLPTFVVRPFHDPHTGADPLALLRRSVFTDTVDEQLVDQLVAAAVANRASRTRPSPNVVLAIGAHPDDVEIGVGGTLAAHVHAGDDVAILTMSRGGRGGLAESRQNEARAAASVIDARLFLDDLPDTEFSAGGETVRRIEAVMREVDPTVVYVHSEHDRHQDHRAVHQAARVAARRVPTLAAYQSPSSTVDFRPTEFVAIDDFFEVKLTMLAAYRSQETRTYLDPAVVRVTAAYWSRFTSGGLVEALEMLRTNRTITDAIPNLPLA